MNESTWKAIEAMLEGKERGKLMSCSNEDLVAALTKVYTMYKAEKRFSPGNQQMDTVMELQRKLIADCETGVFVSRMREMEHQLTETERERDRLQEQCNELEGQLEDVPQVGRPAWYDEDFRSQVKAYYDDGHTYRETAKHFNISTNTVGRFIKD